MSGPVQAWITRSVLNGPANAANVTRDELARLRSLPTPELRAVAARQLSRGQAAFEQVSQVDWYNWANPVVRGANYVRWRKYLDALEEASTALDLGDKEANDADRKTRYLSAYSQARATVETLLQDFQELDRTGFLVTVEMGAAPIGQWLDRKLDDTSQRLGELGRTLAWGGALVAVILLLRK